MSLNIKQLKKSKKCLKIALDLEIANIKYSMKMSSVFDLLFWNNKKNLNRFYLITLSENVFFFCCSFSLLFPDNISIENIFRKITLKKHSNYIKRATRNHLSYLRSKYIQTIQKINITKATFFLHYYLLIYIMYKKLLIELL